MTDKTSFPARPGLTVRVCDRLHKTVRSSKNLAAVLVHARRNPVTVVEVRRLDREDFAEQFYGVAFHFDDGSSALTTWADWTVVLEWLAARRSWSIDRVNLDMDLYEPLVLRSGQYARASAAYQRLLKRGTVVHSRR